MAMGVDPMSPTLIAPTANQSTERVPIAMISKCAFALISFAVLFETWKVNEGESPGQKTFAGDEQLVSSIE